MQRRRAMGKIKKRIVTSNKGFFEVIDMILNKNFIGLF